MAGAVCFYKATFLRSFRSKLRTRITAPCAHKDHRLVGRAMWLAETWTETGARHL
jgi:hypothetical protein